MYCMSELRGPAFIELRLFWSFYGQFAPFFRGNSGSPVESFCTDQESKREHSCRPSAERQASQGHLSRLQRGRISQQPQRKIFSPGQSRAENGGSRFTFKPRPEDEENTGEWCSGGDVVTSVWLHIRDKESGRNTLVSLSLLARLHLLFHLETLPSCSVLEGPVWEKQKEAELIRPLKTSPSEGPRLVWISSPVQTLTCTIYTSAVKPLYHPPTPLQIKRTPCLYLACLCSFVWGYYRWGR